MHHMELVFGGDRARSTWQRYILGQKMLALQTLLVIHEPTLCEHMGYHSASNLDNNNVYNGSTTFVFRYGGMLHPCIRDGFQIRVVMNIAKNTSHE